MADSKISDLTALTGANLASDDLFEIVDTSAGASGSKKITIAELLAGILTANNPSIGSDAIFTRKGAASLCLGAADAAAPVAQTLGVQGVVAGTANTAGANFTIKGSASTGSAAGGSILFQVTAAGGAGSTQNTYSDILKLNSARYTEMYGAGTSAGTYIARF